jgi:hypothetical protein
MAIIYLNSINRSIYVGNWEAVSSLKWEVNL